MFLRFTRVEVLFGNVVTNKMWSDTVNAILSVPRVEVLFGNMVS